MTNKRNEKKRKTDDSYFAVSRRKTRKIMIKILSIGSAVIASIHCYGYNNWCFYNKP